MSCFEDGFRLAGVPSECSLKSKARIDALFGDTRSICSSTAGGWYTEVSTMASLANADDIGAEEQRRVNRAVQARIEAMFASVEAESGTPGECAAAILPVRYLGAAPVGGRVASVRGLQEPLRQLLERLDDAVSAELEVSRRGLTFRTSESCEKNNPFRRIAVWSALRLRARRNASGELSHAFLPLVGDDQGPGSEEKHADLYRSMRGLKSDVGAYPPIFAVIMRRPRAARLLECHAFACHVEEDAVAAAATLYRALLADLDANRRRPRQANGVGCASLASVASSVRDPSPSSRKNGVLSPPLLPPTPPRPTAPHPVRPPRTKKSSISSVTEEEPSSNYDGLKNPRRRKKNSDVKAEDVLEARHRSHPGDPAVPVTRNNTSSTVKGNNKYFAAAKDGGTLSGMEQRENLRNILCDAKPEVDAVSGRRIELCVSSERIYSGRRSVESGDGKVISGCDVYSRKLNEYETMPTKGSLYGFGKKSERMDGGGAVVGKGGNKSNGKINGGNDDVIYGKNEGSYDLQRNVHNDARLNKREIYSSKSEAVKIYDRHVESSARAKDRSPDIYAQKQSVNRRSQEKLYEEHFRDAEKIYSLDREDVVSRSRNERIIDATPERQNNQDNVQYFSKSKPRQDQLSSRNTTAAREKPSRSSRASSRQNHNSSGRESLYSGSHSGGGVSTLDKPLKREKVPGALGNSEIPEYTKPRTRRSSRAGSEPSRSRSEEAENILREVKLKRAQSDLDVDRGDLMTRVELPRRGSFLNSGSTRRVNNVTGGTPLGFTELFDEFRNQEGLTSVDDILAAIIDPEGMSFNDLKPLYKEFLLKLAATLTQDELYQRSASIMRRRKRPQRRRSTRHSGLLGRAIKRSVSRLKGSGPTEFTSVIFPARKLNDSFGSSSSCDARNNNRNRVLASRLGRRRSSWRRNKPGMGQTTSEDSDTGRRLGKGTAANRSSSGYVSCSECSYDSESCTCVSADKCYCSLSRRIPVPPIPAGPTAVCACDTDSCSESNKCYCARRPAHPTILEQLRQRGIVPSEGTLSRGESPERAKISRASRGHASSRSLEFLKIRQPLIASSSDNLALDYDLFSPGKSSQQSSDGEKVLVVSARDPQGRLVYVGGAKRDKRSSSNGSESHHEALSIKKSAEIAAVFGRGSSRTNRRASNASSLRSSASMEAGLGYLP